MTHTETKLAREGARALARAAEKARLRRAARSAHKASSSQRNGAAPPSRLERATGLTPPMLTVALLVMFTSAGFGMVLPFLPLYAEDLGASPVLIGLMVSAFAVGSGAASLAGGVMADRAGRKRSLTLGMLLFGVATLLLAFVREPAAFVALRALEGAGFGLIYPAANALAQDHAPPERLGRALGAYGTVTLLGSFLGPAAGGLLAGRFGYAGTFLVVAGLALVGTALVPGLVKEAPRDLEKEDLERQEKGGGERLEPQTRAFPWSKLLAAAYLAGGVIYLNNGLVQVTEVLYFSNELGADTETVGLLFTLMAFGTLVARYPAGSLVDRVGATPVLVGGLVLSGLFSAAIVLAPGLWAAALSGALAAFFGVVAASTIHVLIAKGTTRGGRGRANSVLGVLSSLGLVVGAPVGTALYDLLPASPFLASGGSFVVMAALLAFLLGEKAERKAVSSREDAAL